MNSGKSLKEEQLYLSRDGINVIKVNNFFFLNENDTEFTHTRDLKYFFDIIIAHNKLFPDISYKIIGFTKDSGVQVCIVLEQPYIPNYEYATWEKIDFELEKMGFIKTVLGEGINDGFNGYTNGIYELTDGKPQNVLVDENGKLHFIDLDISQVI